MNDNNSNKMQNFRTRLCQSAEMFDPHTAALAQVTRLSPTQLLNASNNLDWGVWGAIPA